MSKTKPLVTLNVARRMYNDCRPFRVKLHYSGGSSSKWWSLEYDGKPHSMIECNHGKHGASGRREPFLYDLTKALKKLTEKISKGYGYDSRTKKGMPPLMVPKPKPKITLTGPFAEIRLIKKVADDHYKAFADGGDFLLDLDEVGAHAVVDADPFRIEMQV